MATAASAGYTAKFFAAATTGTAISIAEIRNVELTQEMSPIDATSHDSSGQREIIAGVRSWSGTADYLYAADNASQKALKDLLNDGTASDFEVYPAGSSGTFPIYTGSGYVTSWRLAAPNDDALAVDIAFEGSLALAQSTS